MPTATSVEQIRALPDETVVTVSNIDWTKRGSSLHQVHGGQPFEVPIDTISPILLSNVVIPVIAADMEVTITSSEQSAPVRTTTVIQGLDPAVVQEALHTYLSDYTGLSGGERSGIIEILNDLGLETPVETVTVTLTVNGESEVRLADTLFEQDLIGGGITTESSSYEVTVDWTRTWEPEFETSTGCACERVDQEFAEQLLRSEGIDGSVEDWSVCCTGSNCRNG